MPQRPIIHMAELRRLWAKCQTGRGGPESPGRRARRCARRAGGSRTMRILALAIIASAVAASPVLAADLPVAPPPPPRAPVTYLPPAPPPFTWSGIYIG